MKLTFSGANREVTGSCYHIAGEHANVVLDCGMFQGGKFAEDKNAIAFPFDPAAVDSVVLTHAHFDHTGRLPKLYKEGFRGKIYCTEPTAQLAMLTLRDSVHLMEEEAERHKHDPLYTTKEVEPLQDLFSVMPYHQERQVAPGISVFMADAGHILGSASIKVMADAATAVFSGDLGNTPVPLLHNAECLYGAQAVIVESTYGNRVHEPGEQRTAFLRQAILDTIANKGVLLIPAFAMERTQELLYELHRLYAQKQIPKVPIFLDSPLGIGATEIFRHHTEFFDDEAKRDLVSMGDLFNFPGVTYTANSTESKRILELRGPKVIIAGAGMMNGGRIMHHLRNYLHLKNTTVLIVGFQVEGSLGRRLHQGEKHVRIYGQEIDVQADIRSCGAFSGHADYPRLMQWLHCFQAQPPQHVYVTHGEEHAAFSFAQSIKQEMMLSSDVPIYGSTVSV
jgi:metallo-beta-lactamase family protein